MTLAPAASLESIECSNSSHRDSLNLSESASWRFLIGSSITIKCAGLPVRPPPTPAEIMPPLWPSSMKFLLDFFDGSNATPKILPNSAIFSLFLLPNLSANESPYETCITLQSGCFIKNQLGKVSVIVVDFPCCGGVDIIIISYALSVGFSRNSCTLSHRSLWNFDGFHFISSSDAPLFCTYPVVCTWWQ